MEAQARAVEHADLEPELVAWDATARAELDRLRKQGVVAVRYEAHGCEVSLELLPDCVGPKNRYVFTPLREPKAHVFRETNDLFAQVPLGATTLTSFLEGRRAIVADSFIVGSVGLPPGSTVTEYDLVGTACRRATHVVGAVYVGGFALVSAQSSQADALGGVFAKGGGDPIAHEGYPAVCDRAASEGVELGGCSVPLRLALIALHPDSPSARAPATNAVAHDAGVAPEDSDAAPPTFDQAAIERIVRLHQTDLRRDCFESAAESVRRVTVSVSARIDTHGRVKEADPSVTEADGPSDLAAAVGRCIGRDVKSWIFPEPDGEKVLSLPFHFLRQ